MSVFLDTNHMVLRNPQGSAGNIAAMSDAGFKAIFCNIRDFAPEEWSIIRKRAADAGVACGPWARTTDAAKNFSVNWLDHLIQVADAWESPLIVNSESELKGSGAVLTNLIANKLAGRDAAISMECWPFANVDWTPLRNYPFLPQIFPAEVPAARHPEDCRDQWYLSGVKCVVFTFGSYWDQKPSDYDLLWPYGVYTADDCHGDYKAWSPLGIHDPCLATPRPPAEVDMAEIIGSQHGITAFIDWLQKQPGVPVEHKPDYDSTKPGTWPWPERFERTLNILVKDHDQQVAK